MSSSVSDTKKRKPDLALTKCAVLGDDETPVLYIPSFEVNRGDHVAILGANGAGKTLLLEAMLGLTLAVGTEPDLVPNRVCGVPTTELGVQLQAGGFNPFYTVADVVQLHAVNYPNICSEIRDSFGIDELASKKLQQLSRGQKQRLDLYVALAHKPKVIVFDEPTTGLDANWMDAFLNILTDLSQSEDTTIVMACHTVAECELMNKVCQVVEGRIERFDERETLIRELLGKAEISYSFRTESEVRSVAEWMGSREGVKNVRLIPEDFSLTAAYSFGVESPELDQLLRDMRETFKFQSFGVAPASTKGLIAYMVEDTHA